MVSIRMGIRMAIRIAFEWENICEMGELGEENQPPHPWKRRVRHPLFPTVVESGPR
jgi:hypothetical protein